MTLQPIFSVVSARIQVGQGIFNIFQPQNEICDLPPQSIDQSNIQSICIQDVQQEQNQHKYINKLILESLVENIGKKRIFETQIYNPQLQYSKNNDSNNNNGNDSNLEYKKNLRNRNDIQNNLQILNKEQSIQMQNIEKETRGNQNSSNNVKNGEECMDESVTDNVDSFVDTQRKGVRSFFGGDYQLSSSRQIRNQQE